MLTNGGFYIGHLVPNLVKDAINKKQKYFEKKAKAYFEALFCQVSSLQRQGHFSF
jgi:hypothetical protein